MVRLRLLRLSLVVSLVMFGGCATIPTEAPPAWSDGKVKLAMVGFVAKVTTQGSPDYVPVRERIAAFDNDATLWAEQPMYCRLLFPIDPVKALASQHPEWTDQEPFASLLKGDVSRALTSGGIEFMRPWTERVYGMAPEPAVGSSIKTKFEIRDGIPVLMRRPELNFIDDGAGKPTGINEHIGRRPILAFGNSDGDLQLLQWTAAGGGARFMDGVHHTDPVREWAYDRQSSVGKPDTALDEAQAKGWTVVDMKQDWKVIFPF